MNTENPQEPLNILIDPLRISQVVRNLTENAIKFSKEGEIIVNVTKAKDEFIVSIADQGLGIDDESMKTIFSPFKSHMSSIDVTGLGLGLFIPKNIVEAHKGRIWVSSEGKGE